MRGWLFVFVGVVFVVYGRLLASGRVRVRRRLGFQDVSRRVDEATWAQTYVQGGRLITGLGATVLVVAVALRLAGVADALSFGIASVVTVLGGFVVAVVSFRTSQRLLAGGRPPAASSR